MLAPPRGASRGALDSPNRAGRAFERRMQGHPRRCAG